MFDYGKKFILGIVVILSGYCPAWEVWVLSCFRPIEVALLNPLNRSSCLRLLLLPSSFGLQNMGFIGINELREEHGLIYRFLILFEVS
ncbi:unnamed protein product [Linum tenue]|uniref:Uncharacterized protein n=1 Tax=Linum tenue TaxID=586396 RepID=A0AAV0IP84_9ROSI|nr:unnamed protein product [Linum tenue]